MGKFEASADSVDVAIEKARTVRRMADQSTAGELDNTAMLYFKVKVFFPFIDHFLLQLDQRFPADKTDMFLASKLVLLTIATMTPAEIARVFDWYSADLPKIATFQQEIHRWSRFCQDLNDEPCILPIRCFHFGRPGLLSKYSRNLPHSNHVNRIRTMWTTFFCFEASKATEQNNYGRGQTKQTSIIAHLPTYKCVQIQII